jgi:hypothetical protein
MKKEINIFDKYKQVKKEIKKMEKENPELKKMYEKLKNGGRL